MPTKTAITSERNKCHLLTQKGTNTLLQSAVGVRNSIKTNAEGTYKHIK